MDQWSNLETGENATHVPRITVGIPAYRNAATLERAVHSVINQDFSDWQMMISVDASPDETWSVAQAVAAIDPRIVAIKQDNKLGYMNFGVPLFHANTPYFVWLAGDDWWEPGFLSACLATLANHPNAVSAVTSHTWEGIKAEERHYDTIQGSKVDRISQFLASPNGSRIYGLHRTQAVLRAFPERNIHAWDWYVTLQLLSLGPQVFSGGPFLVRERTNWRSYSRQATFDAGSHQWPLWPMTRLAILHGAVSLRPSLLLRLMKLNIDKHEEAMFVNDPATFLRRRRFFRILGCPINRKPMLCAEAAEAVLAIKPRNDAAIKHLRRAADELSGRSAYSHKRVVGEQMNVLFMARLDVAKHSDKSSKRLIQMLGKEVQPNELSPETLTDLRTILTRFAKKGSARACRALGLLAETVDADPSAAFDAYVSAASSNPWAARDAGRMARMLGDLPAAETWFKQAAKEGLVWANRDLGKVFKVRGDHFQALQVFLDTLDRALRGSDTTLADTVVSDIADLPISVRAEFAQSVAPGKLLDLTPTTLLDIWRTTKQQNPVKQ